VIHRKRQPSVLTSRLNRNSHSPTFFETTKISSLESGRHARCPRELAEHRINVNEGSKPIKQRSRRFSPHKKAAIKKEIIKLMASRFIREILHPDWLTNLVLVQKKNTVEWRMCVDYMDLKKHCLKDSFELPRIDQIIDWTIGSVPISFLDCYSGYHQIALKKENQSKTSFITLFGVNCYKTMSFGLKNVGATYQRAI
jgi:hypothetical protein